MGKPKLFLIDATAFCYRAFYALPQLATSFGQPTNAIYGFMNILNKILKHEKPEYLAICFDVSRDTFRQKKFAEYKIQRPPMPDGLTSQIPLIKEIIRAYALPLFEKAGFEADDIIATIAAKAKSLGLPVVVVSSDKDMLQLVDDSIEVYSPYKDEGIFYNEEKVRERFGIGPKGITDIIALMGDTADNIPGAPGIGEKTAVGLLVQFGTLDKLLDNIDKIKQEKVRKTITEHFDSIKLSKELALLDSKVDIDFELDKLKIGEPDYKKLFDLFKRLEFKKFLKDLPIEEEETAQDNKSALVEDKELVGLMRAQDRLVFYGESLKDLVYSAGNKIFQVDRAGRDLKALLSDRKVKKISHDLKKLKVSLAGEGVSLEGLYFDVMIAAYLLSPSKAGYDLSDIALDYSAKCLPKIIEKQKAVELIIELEPRLEKELEAKALTGLFRDIEMPLVEVLSEMELVGIKLDREALLKLSQDIEKRLVKLIEEIYEASGTQFNINSPKQLREILFEKLKLPVVRKSKTGPSTDEEVLRKLSSKHKLPALLLEYRQLTKLKNTYIDALPELIDKKTGRIHTSFNQTGTETGRLSSSNPNLQNIPVKTDIGRLIRKAIISSGEKSYLLSCDYSQVELRILAHLSGDQNLISAFKEDRDIHRATAALIYGMDEKEVLDKMREVAKRVN
ncbi:MAG: DNA polymerase I, partial [Candidatus Omnitrophica bacterium]|nr:DNA polymerase I [Candidatus Omnitrophota bacterium]